MLSCSSTKYYSFIDLFSDLLPRLQTTVFLPGKQIEIFYNLHQISITSLPRLFNQENVSQPPYHYIIGICRARCSDSILLSKTWLEVALTMDGNKVKGQGKTLLPRTNPMFSDVKRLVKELQSIMSGGNRLKYFLPNNNPFFFSPHNSYSCYSFTLLVRNINICSKVGAGVDLQAAADFMTGT